MISLGIDLSLTGTGLVVLDHQGNTVHRQVLGTKASLDMMERCSIIAGRVLELIDMHEPDAICIEDYAVGKFGGSAIAGISVGAIVRYFFRQKGIDYWLVNAGTLKAFATGTGAAKKEQVMMACYKKWKFEAIDNNEADAYVLARIGLATKYVPALAAEAKAMKKVRAITCTKH